MEQEYRYYISLSSTEIEINPGNISDLKYERKRPVDSCMSLRLVLSGELVITKGYEYDWLVAVKNSSSRVSEIKLRVERLSAGSYSTYYNGYFTTASCKFDEHRRTVRISQKPDDKYRKILENYNKDYNFLDAPAPLTNPGLNFDTWFLFDASGDPDSYTGQSYLRTRTYSGSNTHPEDIPALVIEDLESTDTLVTDTVYVWERLLLDTKKSNSINDKVSGWTKSEEGDTIYHRRPTYNFKSDDFVIVPDANVSDSQYDDYTFVAFGPTGYQLGVRIYPETSSSVIPNTRNINTALKYIVGLIDSDIEPSSADDVSQFFSASTNYFDSGTNPLADVRMAQITDIKSPNASEAATDGSVNLKEFLEDLTSLKLYWFINSSGKFQIEHLHYFDNLTGNNDLTTAIYAPYMVWKNSYEYDTDAIPKAERYSNNYGSKSESYSTYFNSGNKYYSIDDRSGNFKGFTINYSELDRVQDEDGDIEDIDFKLLTFDVRDIMRSPDSYGNNLVCLIAVDSSGDVTRNDKVLNYPFSFESMINSSGSDGGFPILKYNNIGVNGTVDLGYSTNSLEPDDPLSEVRTETPETAVFTAESTIRRKKQVQIDIPNFRNVSFDLLGKWTTGISNNGRVESIVENPLTGMMSFEVMHPEESETLAPVFPTVPTYPTDPSEDNICTGDEKYAFQTTQGYILILDNGDLLDVTDI